MLADDQGKLVTLDSVLHAGPAAITFFRGHWCPYCRIGGHALARAADQIAKAGGRVIGISPEAAEFSGRFKADAQASFQMLTDLDNAYAASLNLVIWVGEELRRTMTERGRAISPPIRATTPGCCRSRRPSSSPATPRSWPGFVDPNMRRRMEVDAIVAAFQSMQ